MLPFGLCRLATAALLAALAMSSFCSKAQSKGEGRKKTEEKVPVYTYVIDDPMDVFGRQPQPAATPGRTVLLPDFCLHVGKIGDTIYRYEYYDAANALINPDTLTSHTRLRFVSLLVSYTDSAHTYKDAQGVMQPLPVSKITCRYDRINNDKWLSVSYRSNKTTRLQEHTADIVRTDTVRSTDGTTTLRSYYRTSQIQ